MDARAVGGDDSARGDGGAGGEEVGDALGGGGVGSAAGGEGLLFPMALEGDASEGAAGVVFRGDADDDAGVGVAFVAGVLAHAVGDDAAWLRGGGDDGSAGAHAEAVDGAAVGAVVDEFVVGGAEEFVAGGIAPAAAVDQGLRVFDAESN